MANTDIQGHHAQDPYRKDPREVYTLIKIVAGICVLYYLIFTSGWIEMHPDLQEATHAATKAIEQSAQK